MTATGEATLKGDGSLAPAIWEMKFPKKFLDQWSLREPIKRVYEARAGPFCNAAKAPLQNLFDLLQLNNLGGVFGGCIRVSQGLDGAAGQ